MLEKIFATCLMIAAQTYGVPSEVLTGIMAVEGGRVGQQVQNVNGTHDLGPMQINTLWIPELARHWNIPYKTAYKWVRDDACTNIHVAAWILRNKSDQAGSLYTGIAHYHSATPKHGIPYRRKVLNAMHRKGLLRGEVIAPRPAKTIATPHVSSAEEQPTIQMGMKLARIE